MVTAYDDVVKGLLDQFDRPREDHQVYIWKTSLRWNQSKLPDHQSDVLCHYPAEYCQWVEQIGAGGHAVDTNTTLVEPSVTRES